MRGVDTGEVHPALEEIADDVCIGRGFLGQRDHDPRPPIGPFRPQEDGRTLGEAERLGLAEPTDPFDSGQ
jgi:hypothetical protein